MGVDVIRIPRAGESRDPECFRERNEVSQQHIRCRTAEQQREGTSNGQWRPYGLGERAARDRKVEERPPDGQRLGVVRRQRPGGPHGNRQYVDALPNEFADLRCEEPVDQAVRERRRQEEEPLGRHCLRGEVVFVEERRKR